MSRKKLYLIGVDSAPLWLLKRLSKLEGMSGFGEFLHEGVLTELESTLPPVTAAAWPSIYSGLQPAAHGVIDFLFIDRNYTRQLIYFNSKEAPPFWELLVDRGIKSLIVTPPMVFDSTVSPNVDLITGWPLRPKFSNRRLEAAAKKHGFSGDPEIGVQLDAKELPLSKGVRKYSRSIKARAEMSKELISKGNYDLIFVCFTETDRIQHYALSNPNAMEYMTPIYREVSKFTEWLIDYTKKNDEESLVMLVSDHGAQPVANKFLPNAFLINKGYAKFNSTAEKRFEKEPEGNGAEVKRRLSEAVMKLGFRRAVYNKLPAGVKDAAERFISNSLEKVDEGYMKMYETDLDMKNTKAFSAVSYGPVGMIWMNDSRFSKPGVAGVESKRLKKKIMQELNRIRCEDGNLAIKQVYDGTKYYAGLNTLILPDILFELRRGYIVDFGYYSRDRLFMKPELGRSGDHTRQGVIGVISNDKSIKRHTLKLQEPSVVNIAPTILEYFGYGHGFKKQSLV